MSTNIGKNEISNFFIQKFHSNKISFDNAKELGINVEKYKESDSNDDNEFDLDEIAECKELYATITSIIEKDNEASKIKDADTEKSEKNSVKQKGGANNH